jgi:hypothetical protein
VLYVHGNHEGYGHHLDKVRHEPRAACAATPNVHFLDADTHVITDQAGSKVRFLGATLWTDFRLLGDDTRQAAMRDAEAVMNDYKRIRLANMGFRKLRAADTAMFHAQQKPGWRANWRSPSMAAPSSSATWRRRCCRSTMPTAAKDARPPTLRAWTTWPRRRTCGCTATSTPRATTASAPAAS